MPRPVWYLLLGVAVVWIVSSPATAGNDVHEWVTGIISFFEHLTRG